MFIEIAQSRVVVAFSDLDILLDCQLKHFQGLSYLALFVYSPAFFVVIYLYGQSRINTAQVMNSLIS
jgi:hypothetical protein